MNGPDGPAEPLPVDELLRRVNPATPTGADLVLDLRELLLERGHPGRCVLCFFRLLGDLRKPGSLAPLRTWLEDNLEIAVTRDGEFRESLPVRLEESMDLEEFCHRAMDTVRHDRCYATGSLELEFRYKQDHGEDSLRSARASRSGKSRP